MPPVSFVGVLIPAPRIGDRHNQQAKVFSSVFLLVSALGFLLFGQSPCAGGDIARPVLTAVICQTLCPSWRRYGKAGG